MSDGQKGTPNINQTTYMIMHMSKHLDFSRSSFLTFLLLPRFTFPHAGAIDKLVIPEGTLNVSFTGCTSLTGKAEG